MVDVCFGINYFVIMVLFTSFMKIAPGQIDDVSVGNRVARGSQRMNSADPEFRFFNSKLKSLDMVCLLCPVYGARHAPCHVWDLHKRGEMWVYALITSSYKRVIQVATSDYPNWDNRDYGERLSSVENVRVLSPLKALGPKKLKLLSHPSFKLLPRANSTRMPRLTRCTTDQPVVLDPSFVLSSSGERETIMYDNTISDSHIEKEDYKAPVTAKVPDHYLDDV